MGAIAEKFRGLEKVGPVHLDLTDEQRKLLLEKTGVDAEYLVVHSMHPPAQVVHIQGHLADDGVID